MRYLSLIRSVKGTSALRAETHLQRLSPIERVEVLEALTKRFHPRAMAITGDTLSARQTALLEKKERAVREIRLPLEAAADSTQKTARMSSSRLRTLAKRELAPLGELVPMTSRVSRYENRIGSWTVHTIVSIGSPCYYLQYIRADAATSLQEGISVLAWLGVAGQTTWDLARAGDEKETIGSIAKASFHFLRAAPELLEGIEPR